MSQVSLEDQDISQTTPEGTSQMLQSVGHSNTSQSEGIQVEMQEHFNEMVQITNEYMAKRQEILGEAHLKIEVGSLRAD